jgi:hypothetical protein
MPFANKKIEIILLFSALIVFVVKYYFFHGGYFGYDDIGYTKFAHKLVNGNFEVTGNLYTYRWVVIFPLALIYKIFGVNDFSNALFGWLPMLAILWFVLKMLHDQPVVAKIVAAAVIVFNPVHLMYLEKPMPDIMAELGFTLMIYGYYNQYLQNAVPSKYNILSFVMGAILVFWAKEIFILYYPFFLYLFVADLIKKQNQAFWLKIIGWLTLFLLLNALFFWWKLGSPIARITAVFAGQFMNECRYDVLPKEILYERVIKGLWLNLIRNGFMIPIGFLGLLLPFGVQLEKGFRFILFSLVGLFLISNFMTASYTHYVPMCPDPRHFLFLMPLLAVAFGMGIVQLDGKKILPILLIVLTLCIQSYISYKFEFEVKWLTYLPIAFGLLLYYFVPNLRLLTFFCVVGLSIQFYHHAKYMKVVNFEGQRELIHFIKNTKDDVPRLVLSDDVLVNMGEFYFQFDSTTTKFRNFPQMPVLDTTIAPKIYVIINGNSAILSHMTWDDMPEYVKKAGEKSKKVFSNKSGEVFLIKE